MENQLDYLFMELTRRLPNELTTV